MAKDGFRAYGRVVEENTSWLKVDLDKPVDGEVANTIWIRKSAIDMIAKVHLNAEQIMVLRQQVGELQSRLASLRAISTDRHPEVKQLLNRLDRVNAQIAVLDTGDNG